MKKRKKKKKTHMFSEELSTGLNRGKYKPSIQLSSRGMRGPWTISWMSSEQWLSSRRNMVSVVWCAPERHCYTFWTAFRLCWAPGMCPSYLQRKLSPVNAVWIQTEFNLNTLFVFLHYQIALAISWATKFGTQINLKPIKFLIYMANNDIIMLPSNHIPLG